MKIKKFLAAIAAGGLLLSNSNAIADTISDNIMSFREAYLTVVSDNRTFVENIDFFGPTFHAELKGDTFILRDASMRMKGGINWEYTNPSTDQTSNENMQFYIEQNNDEMTMYVQRNNRWSKFMLPAVPVGLANAIKTNDINILTENMSAVKSVDILQDTKEKRIMNITLDGKKLSELLHKYNDQRIASLSTSEQTAQKNFIGHLSDALQKTDVNCAWTVDKSTWRSISVTVDFTNLMRAYAKDILDDASKGELTLSADDRHFYEALGYYSELHSSSAYYKADESVMPKMPDGASYAGFNNNVFSDMVKGIGVSAIK